LMLVVMVGCQIPSNTYSADFQKFIDAFGKKYENVNEGKYREMVRNQNLLRIQKHNQDKSAGWLEGETEWIDLTVAEFEARILMKPMFTKEFTLPGLSVPTVQLSGGAASAAASAASSAAAAALPSTVDWTSKIPLTVKNQGACGSCWAFAAIADIEAGRAVKSKLNILFSEQELMDCTVYSNGCVGGYVEEGFTYAATYGMSPSLLYPYKAVKGTCRRNQIPHIKISDPKAPYTKYTNHWITFRAALSSEPIIAGVYASEWSTYKSGVFSCNNNTAIPNHAVLLVGYDSSGNWRIKNSWGTAWGEKGYMWLKMDTCNIFKNLGLTANIV